VLFRRSVYGKAKEFDRAAQIPRRAKVAACLSLLLWIGLVCAGRWIAYFERDEKPGTKPAAGQVFRSRASRS
jgi:hypothetical protein